MEPKLFIPRGFRSDLIPPPRHGLPDKFKREGFYLEIGSGNGLHAINFAQRHPESNLVAIERTGEKSTKAKNRLDSLTSDPLSNLHLIRDDAVNWVAHVVHEPLIRGVFILYPNPYPKESQANKRFHYMPFFSNLVSKLQPGAPVTICTNEPSYFLELREILPRVHALRLKHERVCDPRKAPRTQFEKVFFLKQMLCFEAVFEK